MDLGADPDPWFDGFSWVRFTGAHWEVPLTAVTVYFILIPLLRWVVAKHGKWDVRDFAFYWNASLSVFSWLGLLACVPVLVSNLVTKGMYFTVCAPPSWYGNRIESTQDRLSRCHEHSACECASECARRVLGSFSRFTVVTGRWQKVSYRSLLKCVGG